MKFTDKQFWAMCDNCMSKPVPLKDADLNTAFVYQRGLGVCYVPGGHHPGAMALLLAFNHGYNNGVDACEALGLTYSQGGADRWLEETPGSAFKSSVGKKIQAGKPGSLSAGELRILGDVEYIFSVSGERD